MPKISALPGSPALTLDALIASVQPPSGGVTYKASFSQMLTLFQETIVTPANGGVVYTDANQVQLLAPTATAFRPLLSGSNAAPTWATATYPATTTINQILYSSASNAITGLASIPNSVLTTDNSGVPTWGTSLPGGGLNTVTVTGTTQVIEVNTRYIPNNAAKIEFTLPAISNVGDMFSIVGKGAGGWEILCAVGLSAKTLQIGSSSVGALSGSIESTDPFDAITFVCTTANNVWTCVGGPQGNPYINAFASGTWNAVNTPFNLYTGTGKFVGDTNPILVTPNIGTPSAGVLTSCTGLPLTTGITTTFSNGGIVYSGASSLALLSGTATAGQILRSGASGAPTWSTATYPATTTVNQILYSSSANTISGITTANNAVLVTDGSGVPSLSTTLPASVALQTLTTAGGGGVATQSGGNINLAVGNGGTLTFTGSGSTLSLNITTTTNTGIGTAALTNTSGSGNTAFGRLAASATSSQTSCAAFGNTALLSATSGDGNTAIGGNGVLSNLLSGSRNTALGSAAGSNFTGAESDNVLINSNGTVGDTNTLRIGNATGVGFNQLNSAFICGIYGKTATGTQNVATIGSTDKMGSMVFTSAATASTIMSRDAAGSTNANSFTGNNFQIDANYYINLALGIDPILNFAANSYLLFTRSSSTLGAVVNSNNILNLTSTTAQVSGNLGVNVSPTLGLFQVTGSSSLPAGYFSGLDGGGVVVSGGNGISGNVLTATTALSDGTWNPIFSCSNASGTGIVVDGARRIGIHTPTPNSTCTVHLTTPGINGYYGLLIDGFGSGAGWGITMQPASSPDMQYTRFNNLAGTQIGSISSGSSQTVTAYNTTSDRRLKENIVDCENALELLSKIRVRKFNFKSAKDSTQFGFIADELQDDGFDFMVMGDRDAVDEKKEIIAQQVDFTKLVPILASAIKELNQKITILEGR